MIYVSIGTRAATDPFEQARLRNGDIVKATVAGGDKTVCVLRCGELYLSMPRRRFCRDMRPNAATRSKSAYCRWTRSKRTFYVSQRAVTHDPLLTFSVGQKAEGTVQSLFGTMCLVRVNGLVGTLPVSEAQIKANEHPERCEHNGLRFRPPFHEAADTFSLTPTTNNDLAVGSRVQCTVVKATAHHVFCTFPKRGRLYDAAIRSSEFYWNRPPDVPCQPGDRINAVITGEEIIGKTKYTTLNACALTPNPLLTCETGDTLPCTVLGTTAGGYLMRCGGAVGFLHCSGDHVAVLRPVARRLEARREGFMPDTAPLARGRRPAAGPQTDRRRSLPQTHARRRERLSGHGAALLGRERRRPARGHRDRSHDLQGRHETFLHGVGQFIPQPGTTISEVTVVRIETPGDPKRRHPFVRVTLL